VRVPPSETVCSIINLQCGEKTACFSTVSPILASKLPATTCRAPSNVKAQKSPKTDHWHTSAQTRDTAFFEASKCMCSLVVVSSSKVSQRVSPPAKPPPVIFFANNQVQCGDDYCADDNFGAVIPFSETLCPLAADFFSSSRYSASDTMALMLDGKLHRNRIADHGFCVTHSSRGPGSQSGA
jgi:hypothetical protein